MAQKEFLAKTKNGYSVYASDAYREHMAAHYSITDKMVKDLIEKVEFDPDKGFFGSVDLGYVTGTLGCVEVNEEDDVRFLYRKNRKGLTPFVFNKPEVETTRLTAAFRVDPEDGLVTMGSAWAGNPAPREPWDENMPPEEALESYKFWSTHALTYDEGAIDFDRCTVKKQR